MDFLLVLERNSLANSNIHHLQSLDIFYYCLGMSILQMDRKHFNYKYIITLKEIW